eukprot:2538384-Pyramimonas_sp.AAC.1
MSRRLWIDVLDVSIVGSEQTVAAELKSCVRDAHDFFSRRGADPCHQECGPVLQCVIARRVPAQLREVGISFKLVLQAAYLGIHQGLGKRAARATRRQRVVKGN